jgi:hypothetical protein
VAFDNPPMLNITFGTGAASRCGSGFTKVRQLLAAPAPQHHLKGPCDEIGFSTSDFFHQTMWSGPLIHGLTPFRIWPRIREDIRQSRLESGVNDTAMPGTAVSMTPLYRGQRCQRHRCTLGPQIREALAAFKWKINQRYIRRQIAIHYI